MKTAQLFAAAALSMLAVAGAHAETYDGVQQVHSLNSRANVETQAVATAHAPNQNVTNGSRVTPALTTSASRASVAEQAVAAAHAANQNLDRKAFVNSTIPAEYTQGSMATTQRAGL
ncbi:alpha/beta hydrolase [Variovorax guangxiensis]|uniref:Alpha/beta hydrolase n=1 Tax=Variovorax guangxiensis TaxID=1775474 RepID=A0A502DI00_9BURK|nr:alpha/beta hydrolase [Variovorax guangxiensis]RZI67526.1 MAG: alpha/beta hydrolase [Variovorax sp.]TPG18894.1 alpha/beta hydrolase [Variovorax ginsengisoli]TPG23726.1 alpha/beta hydrolase [Variovorax guangxiensis]